VLLSELGPFGHDSLGRFQIGECDRRSL
jgi:hypothetical protein